jgi:5-methylcytosine-specific restriction endonuclease McrA
MNPRYPLVAQRAGHRCEYCHAPEVIFNFPFEVEHIIPTSRQGADDESNLALACRSCNLLKSDHVSGTAETGAAVVRLFHPRQDRWEEHFGVDRENGAIQELTPVGGATVARL